MRSIRRELLGWLSIGLLLAVAAAAIGTYWRARDEANALFDLELKEMAASLTGAPFAAGVPAGAGGPAAGTLVIQIWDRSGVQVYLSQPERSLPQYAQLGFNTVSTRSGDWRVFSTLADEQIVQVAQPISARRELAASMALRTLVPLLTVVPFLALLVWITVTRGLRPLERVAIAVGLRSPAVLEPLVETDLPQEVQPLIAALNGLLGRLERALHAQQAFVADAAHELRTPLSALHLQAQLAERASGDADRRAAMADLRAGVQRLTRLVEQLLTLAREEPGVATRPFGPVDLAELARAVIADHAQLAAARNIDLGFADGGAGPPAIVAGDADALRTLVANLVANAVRYTPENGKIDVVAAVDDGGPALAVRDTGPGIPAAERDRVFDRFYRGAAAPGPGSGLGLAIVKSIADRHRAHVVLGDGLDGAGLGVTVRFPCGGVDGASRSGVARCGLADRTANS
jgi:two-component system, OmpR family, sensor kinase